MYGFAKINIAQRNFFNLYSQKIDIAKKIQRMNKKKVIK